MSKKVKKKRINSLTPNKKYYSSSEETKTRDNSKNCVYPTLSNELTKKLVPNIMIITKENEFNLEASYTKQVTSDTNDNNITNKPKKKIKKIIKKNNTIKENNWNLSNKINPAKHRMPSPVIKSNIGKRPPLPNSGQRIHLNKNEKFN